MSNPILRSASRTRVSVSSAVALAIASSVGTALLPNARADAADASAVQGQAELAQNTQPQGPVGGVAAPSAPAGGGADQNGLSEVVVTGSRIRRRDYESLSPIVTVNADVLQQNSSIAIETALNQLPQFAPSASQSALSSAQQPFPSATATPGAATLNLRGLGANRTLVLVDGQRIQPINAALVVDVSTIPTAAIDSIETITGGAASTYGADAIAGVVNFKLKQNFQGFQVDARSGVSQVGDDQQNQISALIGSNFADNRGNFMVALTWSKVGGVNGVNHDWVKAGFNDPGTRAGTVPLPEYYAPACFPGAPCNNPTNGWLSPASQGYFIDQNGSVFDINNPMNPAHPYTGPVGGSSGYKINPDGTLGWNNTQSDPLQIPMTKWSAYAAAHYNLNDHVTAYTSLTFSETKTNWQSSAPSALESVWSTYIPYTGAWDNPASPTFGQIPPGATQPTAPPTVAGVNLAFPIGPATLHPVPPGLASLLSSRPNPAAPWQFNGAMPYIGGFAEDNTSTVYQLTFGFKGDTPWAWANGWTWDVYGSHGQTNVDEQQPNGYANWGRTQELFNSNLYGQGFTNTYPLAVAGSCTSGLPIFTSTGGVPANVGPSAFSSNCADWILMRMNTVSQLTQEIVELDTQGSLFDMPFHAGKLQMAFGADWRKDDFGFNPDSGYNANQFFPETIQNIILPVAVQGATTVKELYAEAAIPILKDLPGVKSLEIDPGYRFSEYNPEGSVNTFKVMGNWAVTDWVSFRGGLEVANRAPNVAELFTPKGSSSLALNATDPCAVYSITPTWGNSPSNSANNRLNVQALCNYLMVRGGMPQSTADALMAPGSQAANSYDYFFNGPSPAPFPFALALTGGNPQLKSEVARTITAGIVLRVPFDNPLVSKMSMSIDYYHIQLDGAITEPAFATVYQQCFDPAFNSYMGASFGTYTGAQMAAHNPFCALINREYAPAVGDFYGAVRNYNATFVNSGGIKTAGFDLEYDWSMRPSDIGWVFTHVPGTFSLNVVGNYLQEYSEAAFAGAQWVGYVGTTFVNDATNVDSYFRYKLYTTLNYAVGPFSVGVRWQHLPGLTTPPGSSPGQLGAGEYNLYALFGSFSINDHLALRAGIDNLFDAWPRWVGAIPGYNNNVGATNVNYDTIGR
ncbi:MAG TPA: TonB-dependent receptor, partial [Steroidobacteraceae bacterium]|nr:TonB-dependent receptor [Steroidobacteraceae bacterium]